MNAIEERYRHYHSIGLSDTKDIVRQSLRVFGVYELLVSVILSARCTNKRVNTVTPKLFERYPDVRSMADAEYGDVLKLIR